MGCITLSSVCACSLLLMTNLFVRDVTTVDITINCESFCINIFIQWNKHIVLCGHRFSVQTENGQKRRKTLDRKGDGK